MLPWPVALLPMADRYYHGCAVLLPAVGIICYHGCMVLLPTASSPATMDGHPCYQRRAVLLPTVSSPATMGAHPCYLLGGVATDSEQPCDHGCALFLPAVSGVASMVVWCCYRPADKGHRCCRRRGALLPTGHCCKRPWRKMQATAGSASIDDDSVACDEQHR
jgi:hypothetical protein